MKTISIIFAAYILLFHPSVSPAEDTDPSGLTGTEYTELYESDYDEYDDDPYYEEEEETAEIYDPLEPWNRMVFTFNDTLYEYALKPVAKGYNYVVPEDTRISVRNFFYNLGMPIRLVNDLLQLKVKKAGTELARFGVNSTLGIAGLFDVAEKQLGLKKHDEDLGQTLGALGLGEGLYIVWPVLGPSSLRDTVGLAGDALLDPINHISDDESRFALTGYKHFNNISLRLEDYDDLKESAIDPYTAFKDAYSQYRREQVKK